MTRKLVPLTVEQHRVIALRLRLAEKLMVSICEPIWKAYGVKSKIGNLVDKKCLYPGGSPLLKIRDELDNLSCREFDRIDIYFGVDRRFEEFLMEIEVRTTEAVKDFIASRDTQDSHS